MTTGFHALAADDPVAVALLEEYFVHLDVTFAGGTGVFRPARPPASAFEDGVVLVREVDGTPVGIGGIRRLPDPSPGARRYEVKHLWVRESARGGGHGRALMEELERRARGFGATELVLDTNRGLEAAGALYARLDYRPIERYNDNANATDWYRKDLAAPQYG